MPLLDRMKEHLAYLKFWLGIAVVTDISVAGWLISSLDTADSFRVVMALAAMALLSLGVLFLHRQIERRIDQIGSL